MHRRLTMKTRNEMFQRLDEVLKEIEAEHSKWNTPGQYGVFTSHTEQSLQLERDELIETLELNKIPLGLESYYIPSWFGKR